MQPETLVRTPLIPAREPETARPARLSLACLFCLRQGNAHASWQGERCAILIWTVALLVILGRSLLTTRGQGVYPIFAQAARHWCEGTDLYGAQPNNLDVFRYSPAVAAFFVPLSLLPDRVGGAIWRLVNAAVFLAALAWWAQTALPRPLTRTQRAALFLLVIPLSLGSLNNGQSNALILGLLLAALAAARTERWNVAAAVVALATLFKLYPIALGLLLAAIHPRRFAGRLGLALAAGLVIPFLLQHPGYVWEQYGIWYHYLGSEDRSAWPIDVAYRDLRLLFRVWLVPLSPQTNLLIQLFAAGGIALVCVAARRANWNQRWLLTLLLALATCWMTVVGPATESSTYTLLAPTAAWAVLAVSSEHPARWLRGIVRTSYLLLAGCQLANWLPGGARPIHALGPQPFAGLLLLVGVLGLALGAQTPEPFEPERQRAPTKNPGWRAGSDREL